MYFSFNLATTLSDLSALCSDGDTGANHATITYSLESVSPTASLTLTAAGVLEKPAGVTLDYATTKRVEGVVFLRDNQAGPASENKFLTVVYISVIVSLHFLIHSRNSRFTNL